MTEPPEPIKSEGPICKICGKPMKRHSFLEQKKCQREGKENGVKI